MLKLQYFGHLMWRTDSLERTLMLGKIEGRRRREQQRIRWLGMASPTQSTSVWANSRRWWRARKAGVLQSMGLQRAGHNLVAEKPPPLENVYPHKKMLLVPYLYPLAITISGKTLLPPKCKHFAWGLFPDTCILCPTLNRPEILMSYPQMRYSKECSILFPDPLQTGAPLANHDQLLDQSLSMTCFLYQSSLRSSPSKRLAPKSFFQSLLLEEHKLRCPVPSSV